MLKTQGRGGMPLELLIERVEGGQWVLHGDAETAMEEQAKGKALERLTPRQQSVLDSVCSRAAAGTPATVADVVADCQLTHNRAWETLGALLQKRLVMKQPGERPGGEGRPADTYRPTPGAVPTTGAAAAGA